MKKNIILKTFITLFGLIIIPSFVLAQENIVTTNENKSTSTQSDDIEEKNRENIAEREQLRIKKGEDKEEADQSRQNLSPAYKRPVAELKVLREQNKNEINKIRADFSSTIKANKASTTEAIKEKRQDLIKGIQEKRELFKEELELKRELKASTSIAIKNKFKESLEKIKDENKKIRVESVANNINELNTKLTTRSTENINKIEEVLISIESRVDKETINDANITNVRSLITTAETAITEARTAITAQVAKTYPVTIVNESTVKTSLQTTRDLLKKDIEGVNLKIKSAREATRKAAAALKVVSKTNTSTSTNN